MHVERIDSQAELQALQPDWERVWYDDPTNDPFASFDWFCNWWQHFGNRRRTALLYHRQALADEMQFDDLQPYVLVVRDVQEVVAIAPLVRGWSRWRRMPVRALSFAINAHSPRSGIAIACSRSRLVVSDALSQFLQHRGDWDVLLLDGVPERLGGLGALRQPLKMQASSSNHWSHGFLEFRGEWEAFFRSKTRHFRQRVTQPARALGEFGNVTYQCHQGQDDLGAGLDAFMAIDAASWKATDGESVALSVEIGAYYRSLMLRFGARGNACIWILRIAGRPAAGYLCLVHNRILYLIKTSYAMEFASARHAPSRVLLAHMIQTSWQAGLRGIDFVGRMDFVDRWASAALEFVPMVEFGTGAYGRLVRAVDHARHHFRARTTHVDSPAQPVS